MDGRSMEVNEPSYSNPNTVRNSERNAWIISRNLKEDWASDAMHEAYAARTMGLGLCLEEMMNG